VNQGLLEVARKIVKDIKHANDPCVLKGKIQKIPLV
jgi:hypothetical protein